MCMHPKQLTSTALIGMLRWEVTNLVTCISDSTGTRTLRILLVLSPQTVQFLHTRPLVCTHHILRRLTQAPKETGVQTLVTEGRLFLTMTRWRELCRIH